MTHATTEMKADDNPLSGFGIAALQMMAPRIREIAKDRVKDSIRQALSGDDTLTNPKDGQRWNSDRFSQLRIEECAVSGKTAEVGYSWNTSAQSSSNYRSSSEDGPDS
jgi:hypothetical protein